MTNFLPKSDHEAILPTGDEDDNALNYDNQADLAAMRLRGSVYSSHRTGVPEGAPDAFDAMAYAEANDLARHTPESVVVPGESPDAQHAWSNVTYDSGSYDVFGGHGSDTPKLETVESVQYESTVLDEQKPEAIHQPEHDTLFSDIPMSPESRKGIDAVLSRVRGLGAFGKFPLGTQVRTLGVAADHSVKMTLGQGGSADFQDFGSEPQWAELMNGLTQDAGLGSQVGTIRSYYNREHGPYSMPHIIMHISFPENAPVRTEAESAVVYMYEAVGQHGGRNIGPQAIAAFMSDEASRVLMGIASKDPGAAEYFFRMAFNGLDRETLPSPRNEDSNKGIERPQRNEALLVDGSPLAEMGFFGELLAPAIEYPTLYYAQKYGNDPSRWPPEGEFIPTTFKHELFMYNFNDMHQQHVQYPKPFGTGIHR